MHFDALAWDEFSRAVPVRLALTTPSNWTSTRPMLTALKAAADPERAQAKLAESCDLRSVFRPRKNRKDRSSQGTIPFQAPIMIGY